MSIISLYLFADSNISPDAKSRALIKYTFKNMTGTNSEKQRAKYAPFLEKWGGNKNALTYLYLFIHA